MFVSGLTMAAQDLKWDHIGWNTRSLGDFERFWCGILGFRKVYASSLSREKTEALFGLPAPGGLCRYARGEVVIEVHVFDRVEGESQAFNRFGINHACLHVEDRQRFLAQLDDRVCVRTYRNPGGWENIFIRDFEGNWIELREDLERTKPSA